MPVWVGEPLISTDSTSFDGGKTFAQVTSKKLFGAFFFLSDDIIEHTYDSQTFLDILSAFGGLYRLIGMYAAIIATYINRRKMMAKLIRGLYFIKKPKELQQKLIEKPLESIDFNLANAPYEEVQTKQKQVLIKTYTQHLMTINTDFFNSCFK